MSRLISWVRGNSVLMTVALKQKNTDGTETPIDLSTYDEWMCKVWQLDLNRKVDTTISAALNASGQVVLSIPATIPCGTYSVEVICAKAMTSGGLANRRSYETPVFAVVESNGDAHTTYDVVECQLSADIEMTFQLTPIAETIGKNAYEMWRELPGNEGKTLQDFIDEVLDLDTITAACEAATEAAEEAAIIGSHPDYVGEDNYVYHWTDGSYEKTNIYVKGDKGDQGEKGDKGDKGEQGEKGNPGTYIDPANVEIFSSPSDLIGKTDEQKALMIPNANALSLYEISDSAEIPSSSWIRGSIRGAFGNTYNQYGTWDYMYLIPIANSSKVIVTAGAYRAYIGFVTSTAMSNGAAVPYADGETGSHTIAANATATFNVPSDAKYIVCAQKTGENWAYPSQVVCVYSADVKIRTLKDYTDIELAKKQDKQYLIDLSTATIVAGYDDINGGANNQRTTLRMQRVFKGDVFKVIKPSGVPTATGTMLVRTFTKAKVQLAQTGWVSSYTIRQDGYVTIVVNSGVASGGTTQFLLDALSQSRVIEAIAQQYLDERWVDDESEIIYNRVLQNNNRRYFQFTGQSPFHDTLRCTFLKKLAQNQSMAIYDGVLFLFAKGAEFRAYDYYHLNELAHVSAILSTTAFECNAMWFSYEFYDPADRFPIVYGQAIYTTPYICGFRIQEVNGVWSITKVHEIIFSGVSGVSNLIAFNQRDDSLVSLGTNFITFKRPTYAASSSGVSTLTQDDVISSVARVSNLTFGQDCSMIGDICVGINNVGNPPNAIFGINTKNGELVFHFTPPSPWDEGEGIEWYCGRLYASDVKGNLFEIIFP